MSKILKSFILVSLGLLMITAVVPTNSHAALINAGPGSFTPAATVITFDEVSLGTTNPVYDFTGLPVLGNVTVSFGGNFVGQLATTGFPVTLNPHTPTTGVPLALDPNAPQTFTTNDASATTSPTLSGTPTFNGPISVLFSVPVAGVGLTGGYFNGVHSTSIEAYDSLGNVLGSITNSVEGFEFYGLVDSSGLNVISGISFFITGNEPAGFEIDNLTFGAAGGGGVIPGVPLPPSMLLLGSGLLGMIGWRRFRKD
jgi:hypothetical protein